MCSPLNSNSHNIQIISVIEKIFLQRYPCTYSTVLAKFIWCTCMSFVKVDMSVGSVFTIDVSLVVKRRTEGRKGGRGRSRGQRERGRDEGREGGRKDKGSEGGMKGIRERGMKEGRGEGREDVYELK